MTPVTRVLSEAEMSLVSGGINLNVSLPPRLASSGGPTQDPNALLSPQATAILHTAIVLEQLRQLG
jgi:hypothetical protein